MAFGITGMPSHSLAGFPDGIGRSGAVGVSVGGMGVLVGVSVGVVVGSEVLVKVGTFVAVGVGVSVGVGANALQEASVMMRNDPTIVLNVFFICFADYSHLSISGQSSPHHLIFVRAEHQNLGFILPLQYNLSL